MKIFAIVIVVLLVGTSGWWFLNSHTHTGSKPQAGVQNTAANKTPTHPTATSTNSFDKKRYSLTDPTSIWVIANKQHPLNPTTYVPPDLTVPTNVKLASPGADNMKMRAVTATAIEQLFAAAAQASLNLEVISGYRSYTYQKTIYNQYVAQVGQVAADQESARPGYSEHQSGLAVDVGAANGSCSLMACFGTTPEGEWLAANAYKYGFILRYPADKVSVTGYEYEPWHFRYVGTDLSQEMHKDNIETLEEFFNVRGGVVYN